MEIVIFVTGNKMCYNGITKHIYIYIYKFGEL